MKTRVVFLGTPEFACPTLAVLLDNPEIFDVTAVITQPDRPAGRNLEVQASHVKQLAEAHLNKLSKLSKKFPILTVENVNDPAILSQLKNIPADVAVVVAFGQILKTDFLKLFPKGAVNVHASLLPRWRGAAPIQWCLLNEDPVTGVTLQKLALKLDAGDIIATSELVMDASYDAPKLYSELSRRGAELVRRYLPDYVEGKIKLTPQDESQVTIAPKIKKEQGLIDWNLSAFQICAKIRGLTPWPGIWTTRNGKTLKILRAKPVQYKGPAKPGDIIAMDKTNFVVQCGSDTALQVLVVQPESRSRLPVSEYLKGYPFKKGDFLGG